MPRPIRKRFGATPVEALWRDACGSALSERHLRTRLLRRRDACGSAMARRLRTL